MSVHVRSVHVHLRGKKEGEAKRRKEEKKKSYRRTERKMEAKEGQKSLWRKGGTI